MQIVCRDLDLQTISKFSSQVKNRVGDFIQVSIQGCKYSSTVNFTTAYQTTLPVGADINGGTFTSEAARKASFFMENMYGRESKHW